MGTEGYKQVWIPEALYNQILDRLKEERSSSGTAARQRGSYEGCWHIIVTGPDGDILESGCVWENCPWYKKIFGGTCEKAASGCRCTWGILDRILG
jgi:hypothetical protein